MPNVGVDRTPSVVQIAMQLGLTEQDTQYALIGVLWDAYAAKANAYPWLRYWYTVRHVAQAMLADPDVRSAVTWGQGGVSENADQISKHIQELYDEADAEIKRLEVMWAASQEAVVGQMATTQPGCAPNGIVPNPASPYYRGDPLTRWPQ